LIRTLLTTLAATALAASIGSSAGVAGPNDDCLYGLFPPATVPNYGQRYCTYELYVRVSEESVSDRSKYSGAYAGRTTVRLNMKSGGDVWPGRHLALDMRPVRPSMTINGWGRLGGVQAPQCSLAKRSIKLRVVVALLGTAHETKEPGFPPPPNYGGFHVRAGPANDPGESECQLYPSPGDTQRPRAILGVETVLGASNGSASAEISYRRSQRLEKLSFPMDRIAAGKSFDIGRNWTVSQGVDRWKYSVLFRFIRKR
jgi:hypothetical protein